MRSFVLACLAAAVMAVGAAVVLDYFQRPASVAFTTTGARI
ncbi:MAG TPA: hypothetical protein VGD36_18210 [Xanthobacteraceae bacterium]|jgi:hypothetical protein